MLTVRRTPVVPVTLEGTQYRALDIDGVAWVNLTPHPITLQRYDTGELVQVPQSGRQCRLAESRGESRLHPGCPFRILPRPLPEQITGLPPVQPGVQYLVSKLLLSRPEVFDRHDIFAPDSGATARRNERGRVLYATHLLCAAALPTRTTTHSHAHD